MLLPSSLRRFMGELVETTFVCWDSQLTAVELEADDAHRASPCTPAEVGRFGRDKGGSPPLNGTDEACFEKPYVFPLVCDASCSMGCRPLGGLFCDWVFDPIYVRHVIKLN